MFITLHCGGMPFNGTTIEEQSLGGSESAAYYMAKELAVKGHKVSLFTNIAEQSDCDGVRYIPCGQPTEAAPMGEHFHHYAENTTCDVLIIQRHPFAFNFPFASKVNLWWIHDLALIRNKQMVGSQMWNVDGVLTVSEWHKDQVCEVYGINPDVVFPITNGVDLRLFDGEVKDNIFGIAKARLQSGSDDNGGKLLTRIKLLYSSRPERGLENLVKEGGIMEELYEKDKNFHLYVCGYDNVTDHMRSHYNFLFDRCDRLPNVTNLGALTKQELADVMRQCDLHVYPSTFEETSCITAMECMAAGLPMIASEVGVMFETTIDAGAYLISLKDKDSDIDPKQFIKAIKKVTSGKYKARLEQRSKEQLARAPYYSWHNASLRLMGVIDSIFTEFSKDEDGIISRLINNSDYYATGKFSFENITEITESFNKELQECYSFTNESIWDEHYAKYYKYEEDRGVVYGPEDISGNRRFNFVASLISTLNADSTILDYGCAHGHYTVTLAKQFPDKQFIGIDITPSNISAAEQWAEDEKLTNVRFLIGRVEHGKITLKGLPGETVSLDTGVTSFDCIIAAEVLEHVADPGMHVDILKNYLKEDGRMIITTPYGPWEAIGYKEHWPWRAHVHHFEKADLHDMWSHFPGFEVVNVPGGQDKFGESIGSYVTMFINDAEAYSLPINYERKIKLTQPKQTVSACLIVKDAANSIRRCLESIMPYVDELVIGLDGDENCPDETAAIIANYMHDHWNEKAFDAFYIESPLGTGFDTARNTVIAKASGDWILWLDADEELNGGEHLRRYLKNNQYNGYAIYQHHFTMQPAGILKTDMPVRLFRNNKGVKFFGKVHEHPEIKLNEGVGYATTIDGVSIRHEGYTDEPTRRKRFQRNLPLMERDRKENPDRILGKFLWIRDLTQMCQWELEASGAVITQAMKERAVEGIKLWEELLESGEIRIIVESLEFFSSLNRIIGNGFEMSFKLDTSKHKATDINTIQEVKGYFINIEHARRLWEIIFNERTKEYNSKYL